MNKTDNILVFSYIGLFIIVGLIFYFDIIDRDLIKKYFFLLPLGYAFFLYDLFYSRLWNKKVLFVWSILGIMHLAVYIQFKDLPEIQSVNGNKIVMLKAIPITIFIYSLLNWINRRLFGDNYIVTTFRFNSEEIVEGDKRKIRPMDYIFSIIGAMLIIVLIIFTP